MEQRRLRALIVEDNQDITANLYAFLEPLGYELDCAATGTAGLELAASPVGRDDLPRMDELFFIDHRGVTALSRCDGQPYMAIFAERIAGALRGLFPNM